MKQLEDGRFQLQIDFYIATGNRVIVISSTQPNIHDIVKVTGPLTSVDQFRLLQGGAIYLPVFQDAVVDITNEACRPTGVPESRAPEYPACNKAGQIPLEGF